MITQSPPLVVEQHESLSRIPPRVWDDLVGEDGLYQSHAWLTSIEKDNTAAPVYLLVRRNGAPVGATVLYDVHHEVSTSYDLSRLERWFGSGSNAMLMGPRRGYRSQLLLADTEPRQRLKVIRALLSHAREVAAQCNKQGLAMMYATTETVCALVAADMPQVAFVSADSVVHEAGGGLESLIERSPSKLRSKIRREVRRFAERPWTVTTESLTHCLPEVAELVSWVEAHHGHATPDALLRRLLRREERCCPGQVHVVACRDANGRLLACAVNVAWRSTLFSRAVGLDYEELQDSFGYINVMLYETLNLAAAMNLDRVNLGQATPLKVERGALTRPLWALYLPPESEEPTVERAHAAPGSLIANPEDFSAWFDGYSSYRSVRESPVWRTSGLVNTSVGDV